MNKFYNLPLIFFILLIINSCGRHGDLERPLDQPEYPNPAVIDDRRVYRY